MNNRSTVFPSVGSEYDQFFAKMKQQNYFPSFSGSLWSSIHFLPHLTGDSSDHDVSTDDSDGTIFDKGNDPDEVATKNIGNSEEDPQISGDAPSPRPGSVRAFVENWKDVELHDTVLSPEQVGCT